MSQNRVPPLTGPGQRPVQLTIYLHYMAIHLYIVRQSFRIYSRRASVTAALTCLAAVCRLDPSLAPTAAPGGDHSHHRVHVP